MPATGTTTSPARVDAKSTSHPFIEYGGPKPALTRFTELHRLPRALKPEERIEYDTIGGAFADMRNLLKRFDDIAL